MNYCLNKGFQFFKLISSEALLIVNVQKWNLSVRYYGKCFCLYFNICYKALVFLAAPPKRFYKDTGILRADGKFEITLDQRKLKTPKGNLFTVESEPLALAVANEWNSQKDKIIQSKMHLVS